MNGMRSWRRTTAAPSGRISGGAAMSATSVATSRPSATPDRNSAEALSFSQSSSPLGLSARKTPSGPRNTRLSRSRNEPGSARTSTCCIRSARALDLLALTGGRPVRLGGGDLRLVGRIVLADAQEPQDAVPVHLEGDADRGDTAQQQLDDHAAAAGIEVRQDRSQGGHPPFRRE